MVGPDARPGCYLSDIFHPCGTWTSLPWSDRSSLEPGPCNNFVSDFPLTTLPSIGSAVAVLSVMSIQTDELHISAVSYNLFRYRYVPTRIGAVSVLWTSVPMYPFQDYTLILTANDAVFLCKFRAHILHSLILFPQSLVFSVKQRPFSAIALACSFFSCFNWKKIFSLLLDRNAIRWFSCSSVIAPL